MAKYIPRGSKAFKIIKRINDVYTVKCPFKGRNLRSKIYQLKFTRPLKTMFDEFAAIAQQLMVHYEPMPIIDQLCVLFSKMPAEYQATIVVERMKEHKTPKVLCLLVKISSFLPEKLALNTLNL